MAMIKYSNVEYLSLLPARGLLSQLLLSKLLSPNRIFASKLRVSISYERGRLAFVLDRTRYGGVHNEAESYVAPAFLYCQICRTS